MGRENTSDTGTQQRQVIYELYIADNTLSPLDVAQQVVAQDMPRHIAKRAKQLADKLDTFIITNIR